MSDNEVIHNRVKYDFESWISVKERLPEESGPYLVIYDYSYPVISVNAYTEHLIKKGFSDNHDNKITHWMKLPEPPK